MFFDSKAGKEIHSRNLPHWEQQGCIYFVTFRLADSIPEKQIQQIENERAAWFRQNIGPYSKFQVVEYNKLFSKRIEDLLDGQKGLCILGEPECGSILARALSHFEGQRYQLDHWVIMPNHVHVLLMPLAGYDISSICQNWKSYTAHVINKHKNTSGQLWQHESFDHIVRSQRQLEKFRKYIVSNAESCPNKSILSRGKVKVD